MPPEVAARIAVTGVGAVSALGIGARSSFARLVAGERGFGPVTLFDVADQRSQLAAEVRGLRVDEVAPAGEAARWSRSDRMAVLAAKDALESAGLAGGPLSLALGATTGGMFEAEAALAASVEGASSESLAAALVAYPISATAEHLAATIEGVERSVTICSACSSGAVAIVEAAAWLESGRAERALAGGVDSLCRLTFTGFGALGALDPRPCRPFDQARAGLGLGEGAAFLVLESERAARARGARVLAWLSGWAVAAEAHHITHPDPSAVRAIELIRAALAGGGLSPRDIDYVNAHGTATPQNDAMEARALAGVFGDELTRVRVSSSKGQIGHTLGAAGALEAAFTVLALEQGVAPPTGGLESPDPSLPLRHVLGEGERAELRAALSSSFGFGGTGAVLAFERAAAAPRPRPERAARSRLVVTGVATLGPAGALAGASNTAYADPSAAREPAPLALLERLDPARSRRFDHVTASVCVGVEAALAAAALSPARVGLVSGTAFGNVERSAAFLRRALERGARAASPAEFPHLVPSAPAGNASIYLGLTGPVVTVSALETSAEAAFALAADWLDLGLAPAMVAGGADPGDPVVARALGSPGPGA
ncbi:MAG: beta-ketoacyl-[acyl-carrier-protein] synthase family protein, partial [Sorangiineae bacterium]|nr:beta-ketoacyl-[acyl-carrier-protein] synthase family protein [Sorangiineae bacterium]